MTKIVCFVIDSGEMSASGHVFLWR